MKMFRNWGWSDSWKTLLMVVAIALGIFLGKVMTADHRVQRYVVLRPSEDAKGVSCVKAHREWMGNEVVFCSDDINKTIDVTNRLNEGLRK